MTPSLLPLKTAKLAGGVELAYSDSFDAVPADQRPEKFTTVIALHGLSFNGAVWTPILPFLPSNLRFVAYNQRSYKGASPAYDVKEAGGIDAGAAYLVDAMEFLNFAVEELGAKKKEEGGVVLLGWSKGTTQLVSLLAHLHPTAAPSHTSSFAGYLPPYGLPHSSLISTHLRAVILFEPPALVTGLVKQTNLLEVLGPFLDPARPAPPRQIAQVLADHIFTYRPPSSPAEKSVEDLPPASFDAIPPHIREATFEVDAIPHGFSWSLGNDDEEIERFAKVALEDPVVPTGLMYGTRTFDACYKAGQTVEGWLAAGEERAAGRTEAGGKERKKTAVKKLVDSAHFPQLFEPEKSVVALTELFEELA